MKFSKTLLAAALCLATSAALAGGGPLTFVGTTASFNSSAAIVDSPITDVYTFSVASSSTATGQVGSAQLVPTSDFDFTSIVVNGPSGSFNFAMLLGDPNETWGMSPVLLAAGDYTLTVKGIISAPAAVGSYGGNFNLVAAPVPEPETYALMMAGLGVLGFVARRRKSR